MIKCRLSHCLIQHNYVVATSSHVDAVSISLCATSLTVTTSVMPSFLKQYRLYLLMLSVLGLAPFIGYYSKIQRIRLYVPFLGYTLFLIIFFPILSTNYVELITNIQFRSPISLIFLAQYIRFCILGSLFTVVLLLSAILAPSHANFLNSINVFHKNVCTSDNTKRRESSTFIPRFVGESFVINLVFCAPLFHLHLESGILLDAIVNSGVVFVVMAYMFHVISMARLIRCDLHIIRINLSKSNENQIYACPAFLLFEEFLQIKQSFEFVFGKILSICAVFDFVTIVFVSYMMSMYLNAKLFTWLGFFEGILGFVSPLIVKNVLLSTACNGISNEVNLCLQLLGKYVHVTCC